MSAIRPRQPVRPVGTGTRKGISPALRPYLFTGSGNPGGKPKRQRSVAKAIREMLGNDPTGLICLLLDIAEDHTARDNDRIAAIRELLDRGYGKAPEHAPITDGDPLEMGPLEQAIDEILGRRGGTVIEAVEPVAAIDPGDASD